MFYIEILNELGWGYNKTLWYNLKIRRMDLPTFSDTDTLWGRRVCLRRTRRLTAVCRHDQSAAVRPQYITLQYITLQYIALGALRMSN